MTVCGTSLEMALNSSLRPRGRQAVHPGVGDELAHMLVGMDDDPQVDTIHRAIAIFDLHFAAEVGGFQGGAGGSDRFE
jgi:hypothetical protein